ncbi:hypothetical protein [Aeromicrobium sp.]|uniref:hypothetical protein n=1 Tax=Aeromicrobium sp. TaxID=1871063 RepID=UPI0028A8A08E|nr:hypothetical protein [Aeromicrobium sp.]
MTSGAAPTPEFELTIDGGLGPVLRNALGPELAARTRTYTTLVLETAVDLGALVALLNSRGLHVESVFTAGPTIATL